MSISTLLITGCTSENKKQDETQKQNRYETLEFERNISFRSAPEAEEKVSIMAAVADSEEERTLGLMQVEKLGNKEGMLFLFPDNKPRSFWMANTPLSLDIIFVNANNTIVRIRPNTKPYATENYTSERPAQYVIEVNAGFCVANDIQEGDVALW